MTQDEIINLIHEHIEFYVSQIDRLKHELAEESDILHSAVLGRRIDRCTCRIYALEDLLEEMPEGKIDDEDL